MAIVKSKILEYPNIRWNADWCKRCYICVEGCPKQALELKNNSIVEIEGRCDRTGLCQRLCPDLSIEVIEPRGKGQRK